MLLEGMSRKDVAERLGLSGPAVTGVAKRFLAADALMREAYGNANKA